MSKNILIIAGDGIGSEVCKQVEKIITKLGLDLNLDRGCLGGVAYDKYGDPFPEETKTLAKKADAILLGAVGGHKWDNLPFDKKPERGLLGIRKELGLFANLRPAIVFDSLAEASTLKEEVVKGLDIMIVRELTGGIYFGQPRGIEQKDGEKYGFNTLGYKQSEVERIAKVAFELATKRNNKLCSVDKANVLESTVLWRDTVNSLAEQYNNVELEHMYVDNAAMQLVRNPKQFDVMVTTNMFGDILSDCAAMLTGSLGMLPSASLGEKQANGKQHALYEPVHGSAPDIAGQDKANPLATILSFAMMLRYSLDMSDVADKLETAVQDILKTHRTADIFRDGTKLVGCEEMGDLVANKLD